MYVLALVRTCTVHDYGPFYELCYQQYYYAVVYAWFNPVVYNLSEAAGVAALMIERVGANGIPVNISITTQDINATGMFNTRAVDSVRLLLHVCSAAFDFSTVATAQPELHSVLW